MGILDKKFKREHFPVAGVEGVSVRPMKDSETKRQQLLDTDERKLYFALGLCMAENDGTPVFVKNAGELDETFADRVQVGLDEAEFDLRLNGLVCIAIEKVTRVDVEALRKN